MKINSSKVRTLKNVAVMAVIVHSNDWILGNRVLARYDVVRDITSFHGSDHRQIK
jgi:hypothetical protein